LTAKLPSWRRQPLLAIGVWLVSCFLPAFIGAFNSSPAGAFGSFGKLYGRAVERYLAYCPAALLTFVLASLFFGPLVILLLTAHRVPWPAPAKPTRELAVVAGYWAALQIGGVALIVLALLPTAAGAAHVANWGYHLASSLVLSGLPAIGVLMLLALSLRTRRALLVLGFFAITLLGFGGVFARMKSIAWLPGGIDVRLLSGRQEDWQLAAVLALAWFLICLSLGIALARRRGRVPSSAQPTAG
jgi:hypothetical protein